MSTATNLELSEEEREIVNKALRSYRIYLAEISAPGNDDVEEYLFSALDYYTNQLAEEYDQGSVSSYGQESPDEDEALAEIDRCAALCMRLTIASSGNYADASERAHSTVSHAPNGP